VNLELVGAPPRAEDQADEVGPVVRHPVSRAAKERHCDLMRQGFMKGGR
jgi:hypothetical protein